jgi:general nucleoside transport system permease protein
MSASFFEGVLSNAVLSGTSILYATVGEVIGERAGIVNLGLEGVMLVGAVTGFVVTAETQNPYVGVGAAAFAGAVFNMIFAYLVVTRRGNQLASGLTLMFFALGLTSTVGKSYVGKPIGGLKDLRIPVLANVPQVGHALFEKDLLVYFAIPAAVGAWFLLYRTSWGLRVRAVGEDKSVAFAAGLKPRHLQYQALFVAGMLGGIGGAHLSVAYTKTWQEGMTAGAGFIAVGLVIFAAWSPIRAILGAVLFGGAVAVQLQLQARGSNISPFLLDMIPYLLVLAVLMLFGRVKGRVVPAGLKDVFEGTG